ncbi:hypothetical protein [Domibacillus mangrovi]|uniref:RiboL-PSP-HEPN domain-containing protein n=1 Tax=Domibacillus mangrovi TaxID=1714354 RepID=A0A1Q5NZP4_9BACI|nr:hypothetical protein [Domibacillus mangrovi]OKL35421.1 hypothetical protein BLL40_15335 [Domibacillus mangrovi]
MERMTPSRLRYLFDVEHPLFQFEQYAAFIEHSLRREASKYEKMAAESNETDPEGFRGWHIDECSLYRSDFPNILRSSLLTSLYSFIESKLVALCYPSESGRMFSKRNSSRQSLINKAKDYLITELHVEFPIHLPAWKFIQNTNRIRNCLVHSGGDVSAFRSERKLRSIIANMEHVTIDWRDKIILDEMFCLVFINHASILLSALYNVQVEGR